MSLTSGINLTPLQVKIRADIAGFKSDMEKARVTGVTEADKISKSLESTVKAGEKLASVGDAATKYVSLPLAAVGVAAGKMSMDFGKSMGMVSTLIDGTAEVAKARTKELSKSVLQVSDDTGLAAKNISGGLYEVISAYGDTADSAKILETAAKGAKASGASTTDTIKLLSSVTKGYGDTSAEANEKAADLAFMTAKLGQTTFPELAGSIGQVVPLCESLTISQEELFGVMATATGVTGNASEVTTQFKGILQSLMSPTASMTKLFDELGYANGEAMIQSLGFQGSLNEIVKAAEDAGVPLQDYIGSIEGQVLALALAGAQSENLTEKTKAMTDATGAMNEAYEKSQDNVGAKFEKALNKAMNALIKLGDAAAPMLEEVSDLISEAADWFSQLSEEQQENILKWGALTMAAGPALKIIGEGVQIFAKLKPLVSGASKALETLSAAGKVVPDVMPKAAKATETVVEAASNLPKVIKPAIEGVTDLAEAGGAVTKALPAASKVIEGVAYSVEGLPVAAGTATTALSTVTTAAGETAAAVGGGSGLSGVLSGVLGSSLGTAAVGIGVLGIAAAAVGVGVSEAYKQLNADVVPEVDLFTSTQDEAAQRIAVNSGYIGQSVAQQSVDISDATNESINAYMELDDSVTQSLYNIAINSANMTQETVMGIFTNLDAMGQMVIAKENEQYNTRIEALGTFLTSNMFMEEDTGQVILSKIDSQHSARIINTEATMARIKELQEKSAADNYQLTNAERSELATLQDQMRNDAVTSLTATEQEAAIIRARMSEYQGRLSAEMASELIRNAVEAKDKEIAAAREKRDGIIVEAEGLRKAGVITEEEYNAMVTAANQSCEDQKSAAERTCNGVRDEIIAGTPGIKEAVNTQTGEMLSPFRQFEETVKGIFTGIADWWNGLSFNDKNPAVNMQNSSGATGMGYHPEYNGIDNVPYDGYKIYAHKDEAVLTAEENKAYKQSKATGSGGVNQTFNFYGDETSPYELMRAAKKGIKDLGDIL